MKKKISLLIGIIICVINAPIGYTKSINSIIAVVNNDVILQSEASTLKKLMTFGRPNNLSTKELNKLVINQLIMQKLMLEQAKRFNINIPDEAINQRINQIASSQNLTLNQFKILLAKQGLNYYSFKDFQKNQMLSAEVRNASLQQMVIINPNELKPLEKSAKATLNNQIYKNSSYQIQYIQLRADSTDDSQTQNQAEKQKAFKILSEIKNKKITFDQAANKYSTGPYAQSGGNWDWMKLDEMPTIFAQNISSPYVGKIIGPFWGAGAYNIIKIKQLKTPPSPKAQEINSEHILIKTSIVLDDNAARQKLEEIRKNILSKKESFSDAAKLYSQDPQSAIRGGNLGWQKPEIFAPAFKNTIEKLKVGEISQPFKTTFGWHIVKVLGKRDLSSKQAYVEKVAYTQLYDKKASEQYTMWARKIKAGAYIKIINKNYE